MWPPWKKSSPGRIHNASLNFHCSSFKDIQNLCEEEEQQPHQEKPLHPKNVFHRVRVATSILRAWNSSSSTTSNLLPLPPDSAPETPSSATASDSELNTSISITGADKRIVLYYTSLRVVRKTFEDCRSVRSILRGFRVFVDERDLSMDSGFLEELEGILGCKEKITLPRVFIRGRYIGGAEEIRQLHEIGELKKLIEGLPLIEPGVCDGCGGYRFVLCDQCDGSRKLFAEKGGFRSCLDCNENGLIRCPACSSSSSSSPPSSLQQQQQL